MNNQQDLINSFVAESHDLLDDAEARLSGLEENYDSEIVNTVFRIFHSIKGSAGCLNFKSIKDITHEAEALLSIYREKRLAPSQEEIDLLYQTCDYIRQLVANIDQFLTDDGFEKETTLIVNEIKESIRNLDPEINAADPAPGERGDGETETSYSELVTPEIVDKFFVESNDLLDECEVLVLGLDKNPGDKGIVSDLFRKVHSVKGNAGFLHFEKVEQACMDLEFFLDGMRRDRAVVNRNVVSFLLTQIDTLQSCLASISKVQKNGVCEGSRDRKIGEILLDMGSIKEEDLEEALQSGNGRTGDVLVEKGKIDRTTLSRALKMQKSIRENIGFTSGLNRKDIRVATEKLDKLFDLMGELITAQAMVLFTPAVREIASEEFTRTKNHLQKIVRELHEITLSVRMIPLEGLFNKMHRVVRDLSQRAGKSVHLDISGGDAEMDRNVMEEISDPLIHLLRNAVDHGLETADVRRGVGKEETGSITLSAKYVGSEIWISVKDDGRGLQRERIIEKAVKTNLLSGNTDALPDKSVWDLIFLPGFSTAEQVTNISGRGVGMDVVNRNIKKLNGGIEVKSRAGAGTEIVLKIPLTLAVVDAVITRVGTAIYAIPSLDISEFLEARGDLVTVLQEGGCVLRLREELIPIVRLSEVFDGRSLSKCSPEGVIVVLKKEEKKLCVVIDEIYSSQQIVVKSITDSVGRCRGLSGFSILANGEVSLILDVKEVIEKCIE